jgi:hypothetical protein
LPSLENVLDKKKILEYDAPLPEVRNNSLIHPLAEWDTPWRFFFAKIGGNSKFKNELCHLTQLAETSKMNTIIWVFHPEPMAERLK